MRNDRQLKHPLTDFHVQRVTEICARYRHKAIPSKPIGTQGNRDDNSQNSFLFNPFNPSHSNPKIDPDGPLGQLIEELKMIPVRENDPNGPMIE